MRFYFATETAIVAGFLLETTARGQQAIVGTRYKVPLSAKHSYEIVEDRLMSGDFRLSEDVISIGPEIDSTSRSALVIWHRLDPFGSPKGEASGGNVIFRHRIELTDEVSVRLEDSGEEVWSILLPGEALMLKQLHSRELKASCWERIWYGRKFKWYWVDGALRITFDGSKAELLNKAAPGI